MTKASTVRIKRPPRILIPFETPRAISEYAWLNFSKPMLSLAPKGDGHSVLVCPGFMASDMSTVPLRRFLKKKGYDVHGWQLGRNLGVNTTGVRVEKLIDQIKALYDSSGGKVTLIGWSLGGVMAREAAKIAPDYIRQVITLGSPFSGGARHSNITWLYEKITGHVPHREDMKEMEINLPNAPEGIPTTSIFTKTDAIVPWRSCLEKPSPLTQNIRVYASHCGIGVNPVVFALLADRLVHTRESWVEFKRKDHPILKAAMPRQRY